MPLKSLMASRSKAKLLTNHVALLSGWFVTTAKTCSESEIARNCERKATPQVNVKKLFDLTGRVAIVSGGSMGLGLQMAEGLAEMGANLAICARKQERCEEAAEALRSHGVQTLALGCDVKDKASIAQAVEETLAKFGRVDILV